MTQMWPEIQVLKQKHPNTQFTKKAIHNLWHKVTRDDWMLDSDEILSAEKLISESQAGRMGKHPVNRIPLESPEGFQVFGFDIPDMCKQWCLRMREGAMDSTCKPRIHLLCCHSHIYAQGRQTGKGLNSLLY
jgi:hypothetical protein